MKKSILIIVLTLITLHAHCQIKVKFINRTNKLIALKMTAGDSDSPVQTYRQIHTQTIQPNQNDQDYTSIKNAKKKQKILVIGTIDGLGDVKFQEMTITKRNQLIDIVLNISASEVPADNQSYQRLVSQLNFSPPSGSEKVMSAEMAYKTYFGALSLRKGDVEVDRIEPNVLKAEVTPVQYGTLNKTVELFFSGNFISDNKGTAPGIASVNLNVAKDELYKLKYNLSGIGNIVWSNSQNKSIAKLFSELDDINKQSLALRYLSDTTLKMYQYDNMYLFNLANLQVEKYKRTSTTIDASVPVFFSSNTAFKKEDGENYTTSAATTVLNIWATKDLTYLLAENAKNYLAKQKQSILNSSTSKDAQNVLGGITGVIRRSIDLPETATKDQILREINTKIKDLDKTAAQLR